MIDWFSPEWLALIVAAFGAVIAIQSRREATRNSRLEKIELVEVCMSDANLTEYP